MNKYCRGTVCGDTRKTRRHCALTPKEYPRKEQTMYEVIVNKKENTKTIMLLENKVIIEKYDDNEEINKIEGNIYLGKVQNVLPGMQAAFIDIGERKNTFIHLKDILPKVDTKSVGAHDCNPNQNNNSQNIKKLIKPGMPILVQVKKDSTNKKGARVSTHISLPR